MDNKVAGAVHGSLVPIYQHKIIPLKISHPVSYTHLTLPTKLEV